MKLKYWLAAFISLCVLLFFSHIAKAQFVAQNSLEPSSFELNVPLQQIQSQTVPFRIGHVEDSQPVSYAGRDQIFCDSLSFALSDYSPEKVIIPFDMRFKHFEKVAIECGPNSITKDRINNNLGSKLLPVIGKFSQPFFKTEAKIVIKNSKKHLLNPQSISLKDISDSGESSFTVGVIAGTTSEEALKSTYPNASLVEVKNRTKTIELLTLDGPESIDAYISDEVLLPSVIKALEPNANQFSIEPKLYGFTNEYYGIVVYDDPSNSSYKSEQLLRRIETWLNSDKGLSERKKLERELNYNAKSEVLKQFISRDWLYNIPLLAWSLVIFLLSVALFLFLLWVLPQVARIPSIKLFFNRLRNRGQDSKVNQVINVFVSGASNTLIPNYIDRNAVAILLNEVNEPIIQANSQTTFAELEKTEQVVENLANRAESDSYFHKVLKAISGTVGNATREETSEWWKTVIKRALERLEENVQNTINQ